MVKLTFEGETVDMVAEQIEQWQSRWGSPSAADDKPDTKTAAKKTASKKKAEPKSEPESKDETPDPEPENEDKGEEDATAESYDVEDVRERMAAMMQKDKENGPKSVMAVLKEIGVAKASDLDPEQRVKFMADTQAHI